jgi:glutathione S-transferase
MRLYALAVSHPAHSARLMLEYKNLEHSVAWLLPGFQPIQLRLARFRGATVPALKLNGWRVQGSRAISRALEQMAPEPRLFPADPAARRAVEDAERWGDEELQPIPRRLFRWAAAHRQGVRRWIGKTVGLPGPGLAGALTVPVALEFARRSGATDARVRDDLRELPLTLDRVDELIVAGTIGGETPTAADFQIAPSVRLLMAFEQLRPAVEARPAGRLALRLLESFPEPVPVELLDSWLESVRS